MAVIRKRKTTDRFLYDVDFYYRGKRYVISTKTSDRKIAMKILNDIQGKIVHGTFNILDYEKKEISLEDFQFEYFRYAPGLKHPRTILQERHYLKKLMGVVGPHRHLRMIDHQSLDLWRAKTFKGLSPTTYNIERRTLQAIFNIAIKWGYLDENPFSKMPKIPVDEVRRFATVEEVKKIFDAIDEDILDERKGHIRKFNILFRLYLGLLLNTGLRRNEAISLRREHLDFKLNTIYVQHTKGKRFRLVPMNRYARDILLKLDESLFSSLKPGSATHKFNDLMVRLGLTHLKLHSLRHTFATNLVSAGVDIYVVKELLGHQDIRTSMVYAKADTNTLRRAVEQLKN